MPLAQAALKNMIKDDVISLALDWQDKFNSSLANFNEEIWRFTKKNRKYGIRSVYLWQLTIGAMRKNDKFGTALLSQ